MFIECILVASSLCHTIKDKPVMALLSIDVVVKTLDVRQTLRDYNLGPRADCSICSFHENNSTVRPLLSHPASFYAFEAGYALTAAWIGHKMRGSRHRWIHDLWWVPQTISISENIYAYTYTRTHFH
jgi:hypothetical protein